MTGPLRILSLGAGVQSTALLMHGIVGTPPGAVECLIGISLDEVQRMKPSDAKYIVNCWPLVDRGWTRDDCRAYLERLGIAAPRSACIGCPYHSDREWRALRDDAPDEFADAVVFERELQATGAALRGIPYLHRQRVPLDEVDARGPRPARARLRRRVRRHVRCMTARTPA